MECHTPLPNAIRQTPVKSGFTLVEVLVVLFIMGVIAALTIPSLILKYTQRERISQIKEAYMLIQAATKMAIAEHGFSDGWDFSSGGGYATKYFIPYVKIQKDCGSGTSSNLVLDKGCFEDNDSNGGWKYLNGNTFPFFGGGYSSSYYRTVKLQNGMDVGVWAPAKQNQTSHKNIIFIVDVNGGQGSTTLGRDVFAFAYNYKTGLFTTGANYNASNNITDRQATDCTVSGKGISCLRILERNGWKYPTNYPVNP